MNITYKPSEDVLYRINEAVDNPMYDRRCNYGIRHLKQIPKGFPFRLRTQEMTYKKDGVEDSVVHRRIVFVGDGVTDIDEKIVDYNKKDERVETINPLFVFLMDNSSPANDIKSIFVKHNMTNLDVVDFAKKLIEEKIMTEEQLAEILVKID